jgi:hypothetical protein
VSPTGWANAATIDIIYDILHMMGRDDIPVGLGDVFAVNQTDPILPVLGDCKYVKAIPHGSGGYLVICHAVQEGAFNDFHALVFVLRQH